eukprot:6195331-Pleurochrysis_carterae.AAC.2
MAPSAQKKSCTKKSFQIAAAEEVRRPRKPLQGAQRSPPPATLSYLLWRDVMQVLWVVEVDEVEALDCTLPRDPAEHVVRAVPQIEAVLHRAQNARTALQKVVLKMQAYTAVEKSKSARATAREKKRKSEKDRERESEREKERRREGQREG